MLQRAGRFLRSCSGDGLCARGLPRPEALRQELQDAIISGYKGFLSSNDPGERLNLFDTFRVLCPVREGPYGVKAMNRLIQDILAASGLLEPAGLHYSGRPILVTENDYSCASSTAIPGPSRGMKAASSAPASTTRTAWSG
jgi:hypothetical protein